MASGFINITDTTVFDDAAALTAFDTTSSPNGIYAIVNTLGSYQLDIDARGVSDGVLVIDAFNQLGRWNQRLDMPVLLLNDQNQIDGSMLTGDIPDIELEDGTALDPSLGFIDDPDTGVFRPGDNIFGITAGGVLRLSVSDVAVTSTVPILVPNGSAAAPTISFSSETNTGLYMKGAAELSVSLAGVNVLDFNVSSVESFLPIRTPRGTAALPAYSFIDDPDSGIYSNSANVLSIVTGGTARIFASTTLIGARLPIGGVDGTALTPSYVFESEIDSGMFLSGAGVVAFSASGVQVFAYSSNSLTSSVEVLGIDGTALLPSFSFALQGNTGVYRSSTSTVGLTSNGVLTFSAGPSQIDCFQLIRNVAGTALLPAYSFTGDTNSGIYNGAANTINFSADGVSRVQIETTRLITQNIRFQTSEGANVTAVNNMTLGNDGVLFQILGSTGINLIDTTNWQNGSTLRLKFATVLTVTDAVAGSGNFATINLRAATRITGIDSMLTLVLWAGQWYESAWAP